MPWTQKQTNFFRGVAHGMKPRSGGSGGGGGGSSHLSPSKAKALLDHEDRKVQSKIKGQKRALEEM